MGVPHYWSPALVGWVGFGGGGGVGFGYGNVGWVPLAPYEIFHPWWGRDWYRGGGYFNRQVSITNINVTNVYRNSQFNAVNGMGSRDFADGRFSRIQRYNGSQVGTVGALQGATPFAPGRQNLRFTDRAVSNPPRPVENARFFRSQTPATVERVPFQQFSRGSQPQGRYGAQGAGQGSGRVDSGGNPGGWRRFGQPAAANSGPAANPSFRSQVPAPRTEQVAPRQDNRAGWDRFGSPGGASQAATPRSEAPAAPRDAYRGGFGQTQPRQDFASQPRNNYASPNYGGNSQESLRVAPPVVRQRPSNSAPSYSAPRYSAPSAPRYSAPRYSAPRSSAPSYSAPRSSGGGGGGGHSSGGGGGGGSRGR